MRAACNRFREENELGFAGETDHISPELEGDRRARRVEFDGSSQPFCGDLPFPGPKTQDES